MASVATRRRAPWRLRTRLNAVVAAVVAVLAVNVAATVLALDARDTFAREERRVYNPARVAVASLGRAYVDQETGVRGYVLGGEEPFLDPWVAGVAAEAVLVERLRSLLTGDPEASGALDEVLDAARAWQVEVAEPEIAFVAAGEVDAAEALVATGVGRVRFGAIRSALGSLEQAVEQHWARDAAAADAAQARRDWVLYASAGAVVLIATTSALALGRWLTRPLDLLVSRVRAVGAGDLAVPVPSAGPPELAEVGAAVEAMRRRLLDEAAEAVRWTLITSQEDERRRLASEIHDDPVQVLTAASLRLQRLRRHLDDSAAGTLAADAEVALAHATDRLRRMIFELHPPTLATDGLVGAIELYAAETFDPSETRATVEADVTADVPPAVEQLAYRLTREALANVARHAAARCVDVRVRVDEGGVSVRVRDDGVGYEPAVAEAAPGHLGTTLGRDLSRAAGGRWHVTTAPGRGTVVDIWLPREGPRADVGADAGAG